MYSTELNLRTIIFSIAVLASCADGYSHVKGGGNVASDHFLDLLQVVVQQIPSSDFEPATASNEELYEWGRILSLFRHGARDSCRALLQKYNYRLIELHDPLSGNTYDVFKEDYPIRRGWGTFIHNRSHKKRLYIHVAHPLDDSNTLFIGGELLRRIDGEWLFIAGTSRSSKTKSLRNALHPRETVFERWHEILTDLTHLTISLHGFDAASGRTADIVLSNGRTSDDQWGISQLSVAFRDTMRALGFNCMLAMYDSGYAKLAGRSSQEGIFSNDSVGFGHWLNVELSSALRSSVDLQQKFVSAASRSLELTGTKVSHQMNRAFGLVSPRVVHIDSSHRILFPPPGAETYRIVSFNASDNRNDTINVRMGNWLGGLTGQKSITTVTRIDSANDIFSRAQRGRNARSLQAQLFEQTSAPLSPMVQFDTDMSDSSMVGEEEPGGVEPLQVHRIPLRRIPVPTYVGQGSHASTPFTWNGIMAGQLGSATPIFEMNAALPDPDSPGEFAKFLIPIINNSFQGAENRFIGIQMTDVLVGEIARLVSEHEMDAKDIGLLAEKGGEGDYYLRIFPNRHSPEPHRHAKR